MIAIDSNILVYAHRRDSEWHIPAAALLKSLAEGRTQWAIPWPCIQEFLAITTHQKIYAPPSTVEQAAAQVDAWLDSPSMVPLGETDDHWTILRQQLITGKVQGSMVHDARITTLCMTHGISELLTTDRDFSRSPQLKTRNPLFG